MWRQQRDCPSRLDSGWDQSWLKSFETRLKSFVSRCSVHQVCSDVSPRTLVSHFLIFAKIDLENTIMSTWLYRMLLAGSGTQFLQQKGKASGHPEIERCE